MPKSFKSDLPGELPGELSGELRVGSAVDNTSCEHEFRLGDRTSKSAALASCSPKRGDNYVIYGGGPGARFE